MIESGTENEQLFRERVRDAIQAGGKSGTMSKKTGIPVGTLNKYVALRSSPSALNALKIAHAVGLTLEELATGKQATPADVGGRLDSPLKASTQKIDDWTMRRMAAIVTREHREAGAQIAAENVAVEAAELYNELLTLVADPADRELVEAALPQMRLLFKRRLEEALASPGSGKLSAS